MTAAEQAIISSTIKLLSVKPLENVTVTEICKEADISKRTFYNYYKDKFDIIINASSIPGLEVPEPETYSLYVIEDYIKERLNWLVSHKKFLNNISTYTGQNSPVVSFKNEIREYLTDMIEKKTSSQNIDTEILISIRYFTDGIVDLIIEIILSDEEFAKNFFSKEKFLENFIPQNLREFLYY